MIPISADQAVVMAMRPEPLLATKVNYASLTGADNAYETPLELVPHKSLHGAAERVSAVNSEAGSLDISADVLTRVLGFEDRP